jgi:hypothetical protein
LFSQSIGVAVPPPPPPPPQPVEEPQRDRALDWQPPTGEPATKKPKLTLLSEDEFTAANPVCCAIASFVCSCQCFMNQRTFFSFFFYLQGPIALTIAVPQDDEYAQFNFNGQRLEIQAPSARATFASLKEILSPLLGMFFSNHLIAFQNVQLNICAFVQAIFRPTSKSFVWRMARFPRTNRLWPC